MQSTTKKSLKIISLILVGFIVFVISFLLGYVIYLSFSYYRIADNTNIQILNPKTAKVQTNTSYTISTYNIGFGAYSQDFDFFMDSGEMLDGTKVSGSGSRAKSRSTVIANTVGAIAEIKDLNCDFSFFQEVDTSSHRSFFINQYDMIKSYMSNYSSSFSSNFHSGYLFYPISNPHGVVNAGIVTLSKYNISSSTRIKLPIDESFFNKFFDLDRCFEINRLDIANSSKQLVLINLHFSAYDEGGKIRAKQLEVLNNILVSEKNKGNYIIVGGDFNHDIANSLTTFPTQQKIPTWVAKLSQDSLPAGFSFASSTNAPTCRSTDMPYYKGINYSVVIDGFIVSDNIIVEQVKNIDTDFKYSDHNPVKMNFKLQYDVDHGSIII